MNLCEPLALDLVFAQGLPVITAAIPETKLAAGQSAVASWLAGALE